jgi:hypothetical protein
MTTNTQGYRFHRKSNTDGHIDAIPEHHRNALKFPLKAHKIVNLRVSYVPAEPNSLGLHLFVVLHAGQPFPCNARLETVACQPVCSELLLQTHQAL